MASNNTVSVGQKLGCGLAGSSASGLSQAVIQVSAGAPISSEGSTGEDPLPKWVLLCLLARFNSLQAIDRRPPLVPWQKGLYVKHLTTRWQASKRARQSASESPQQDGSHSLLVTNLITEVASHHHCYILLISSELQGPAHPQGEESTQKLGDFLEQ